MAIENGVYELTTQDVATGSATIATEHASVGGEATCQVAKPKPKPPKFAGNVATRAAAKGKAVPPGVQRMIDAPGAAPTLRVLHPVVADKGDLVVQTRGLKVGALVHWTSVGGSQ